MGSRVWVKSLRRGAAVCAVGVACATAGAASAQAEVVNPPDKNRWGVDGRVSAIVTVGGKVYLGGSFTHITDRSGNSWPTGGLAVYEPSTGQFDVSWRPQTDGAVNSLAVIGETVYFGGSFRSVEGASRRNLGAVNASTGALVGWSPSTDQPVETVAASGGDIYIGGNFTNVTDPGGVKTRSYVARLSAANGAVDAGWSPAPNAMVRTIKPAAGGSRIFLGGEFTSVSGSGSSSNRIASITLTGAVDTAFKVAATNGSQKAPVFDIDTDGTRVLIAAGGAGGGCTLVNATTGARFWGKRANGNLQAVRLLNGVAYCGGHFSGSGSFDGQSRNKLAAVGIASGSTLGFAPRINSALGIWALSSDASHLFAGGDFTKVSNVNLDHFAVFDED